MTTHNLPDHFLSGKVGVKVTTENVDLFVETLVHNAIPYYYDIKNFISDWCKKPSGNPHCYYDVCEQKVHINGAFNPYSCGNVEVYDFAQISAAENDCSDFLNLL